MSPRLIAVLAAGVLFIVGLIGVVAGVSISTDGIIIDDVACGNALGVLDSPPVGAPANWRTLCEDAVEGRQMWAWPALAIGLLGAVVALAMMSLGDRGKNSPATPPAA